MDAISIIDSAKGKTVKSSNVTVSDGRVVAFVLIFTDDTRLSASSVCNYQSTEEEGAVTSIDIEE